MDAVWAQNRAEACHPGVVGSRHLGAGWAEAHCTEFVQRERSAALTQSELPEDRRTACAQACGDRDDEQERKRQSEEQYRDHDIQAPAAPARADSPLPRRQALLPFRHPNIGPACAGGCGWGVVEEGEQVVVVEIRVRPRREAHRQKEVLPADLAEHERREPARVQPESVFRSAGPALEVDAHPLGAQVDVPASFDGSGYLESHRHVDALEEIRTQFAKAPEVLYKGIAKVRSRLRESGTDCLDLRTPRAGVCVQILVAVAEVKVAPEAVGYMPTG